MAMEPSTSATESARLARSTRWAIISLYANIDGSMPSSIPPRSQLKRRCAVGENKSNKLDALSALSAEFRASLSGRISGLVNVFPMTPSRVYGIQTEKVSGEAALSHFFASKGKRSRMSRCAHFCAHALSKSITTELNQ
jgi:hypothetical protein